ncbi:unnamed protein product, partial [marine sediment metagenome]
GIALYKTERVHTVPNSGHYNLSVCCNYYFERQMA